MKKRLHQFSVIAFLSLSGLALHGQSALLSNLDQPAYPSPLDLDLNQFIAAPFITGSSPSILNSATVLLPVSQLPTGQVHFYLYSDASGLPGGQVIGGALNGPASLEYPGGSISYSATDPIPLSPNTQYWLVGTQTVGSPNFNYGWYEASSYDYSSSVGWQLPGYFAFSNDQGATWTSTADAPIPLPVMFEISGSVVPEPAILSLFSMCVLSLWWRMKRPNRSSQLVAS